MKNYWLNQNNGLEFFGGLNGLEAKPSPREWYNINQRNNTFEVYKNSFLYSVKPSLEVALNKANLIHNKNYITRPVALGFDLEIKNGPPASYITYDGNYVIYTFDPTIPILNVQKKYLLSFVSSNTIKSGMFATLYEAIDQIKKEEGI